MTKDELLALTKDDIRSMTQEERTSVFMGLFELLSPAQQEEVYAMIDRLSEKAQRMR